MAEPVMFDARSFALCALLAMMAVGGNAAEALVDPTRPAGAADIGNAPNVETEPALQAIRISAGYRSATINGRTLKQGDKFGDAEVVRIAETEVVLRRGGTLQTLKLFPQMQKRLVFNGADVKPSGPNQ